MMQLPDARGRFGAFGGRYVPETLVPALEELAREYEKARRDPRFKAELDSYLREYVGRPTPLYYAERLSKKLGGAKIYLKREDLCHTGAHKINNTIGQGLLTRRMRKQRVIAETGAGQHGVGGGSNSIGLFTAFLKDKKVKMVGVEAGGLGIESGKHSARFATGSVGVLHGTMTYLLQDDDGQIQLTHSVSAGLDYAAVGPEHAFYKERERISYTYATDEQAMTAFDLLSQTEGLMPALEPAHAVAHVMKLAPKLKRSQIIVINLSGRGDKDVHQVARIKGVSL